MTADTRPPGTGLATGPGWRDPHLLAGRSRAAGLWLVLGILLGALADTTAFKTTLDLLLRLSQAVSWGMAVGATCVALVAAGRLGIAIAGRRRDDTRYGSFAVAAAAIAWLGLGLAMFITRLLDAGSTGPAFGNTAPQAAQHTTLIAIFFLAIYLASGICMIIEAQRLHNPAAAVLWRLGKRYDKQVTRTAKAEAEAVRAQQVVDLHNRELIREYARYRAAITARKALAGEAASHARLRMAEILSDPSKTGITEIEPILELPPAGDNGHPDRHDK